MAGVAHRKWGLETTVLRISSDAIISSLLRYGLTVLGSGLPEDLVNKIDVQIINTTARRITGLHPSTRIEILHFLAGTHTYKNLYIRHCANFLHSTLTAHGSHIQTRMRGELGELLNIPEPNITWKPLPFDKEATFLLGPEGLPSQIIDILSWQQIAYVRSPHMHTVHQTPSIYHAHAPEILRSPVQRNQTFRFQGSYSWLDVALKALFRVGWRPESSCPQKLNVARLLPPDPKNNKFTVDKPLPHETRKTSINGTDVTLRRVRVTAQLLRVDSTYATMVIVQDGDFVCRCQGRVLGRSILDTIPESARDSVILHATQSLKSWLETTDQNTIQDIDMRAGDPSTVYAIRHWYELGSCSLESSVAPDLLDTILEASKWLKVRLSLRPHQVPETFDEEEQMDIPTKLGMVLAEHLRTFVLPAKGSDWYDRLPRIPCTKTEIKNLLDQQQKADEQQTLYQLSALGSESATIIKELELSRELIAEVMNTLRDEREAQVNLFTILSATRFRTFCDKQKLPTQCPRPGCNQRDDFHHLIRCYQLTNSIESGADAAALLVHLARNTQTKEKSRPWYSPSP